MCEQIIPTNNKKPHYHDVIREFRIEDNILIEKEISINREPINISEVLLQTLKGKPNCIDQVDAVMGKQDIYANMSERSIKCALWLKKQGVKSGDIIGLCCDNNMDAIIIMLGTMYIYAAPFSHLRFVRRTRRTRNGPAPERVAVTTRSNSN